MQRRGDFLATSVASNLLARFSRTHERRRISVVAGHPGIGKTKAIEQFCNLHKGQIAVVELGEGPKGGHSSTAALNFAVAGIADVLGREAPRQTTSHLELRQRFRERACDWGGIHERLLRDEDFDPRTVEHRTIIFDEAQHLSMGGIEALRSISDAARGGFSPFPIGLIFVGNNTFALKSTPNKQSVLTEAVADRLLYNVILDYDHVTDDDLSLYLDSQANFDSGAMRIALAYMRSGVVNRSFRSADALVERLQAEIGKGTITSTLIRHVLGL